MTSEGNRTPNAYSLAQCLQRERERLQWQQQINRGQNILPVSAVSMTMTPNACSLAQCQQHKCERQQQQQERGQSTSTINEVLQFSNAFSLGQCLQSISKSQGQSVPHVGLYLCLPVFAWAAICSSFTCDITSKHQNSPSWRHCRICNYKYCVPILHVNINCDWFVRSLNKIRSQKWCYIDIL